jgi:hypothetical protein
MFKTVVETRLGHDQTLGCENKTIKLKFASKKKDEAFEPEKLN